MKSLLTTALVAGFAVSAQALDSTTTGSGNWTSSSIWSASGVPVGSGTANIINGNAVDITSGSNSAGRVYVETGTLNINSGSLTVNVNTISAILVARGANTTGVINVNGGSLISGTAGGALTGIQLGVGNGSSGTLNLSSGLVYSNLGIHVGTGSNAVGTLVVTGGTLSAGNGTGITGSGTTNVNVFIGGRRASGATYGVYEQTAGTVLINDQAYFNIGSGATATSGTHNTNGIATITGGEFTANVRVGRENTDGQGSGELVIGAAASVSGGTKAWEVASNGRIVFELGSTDAFNAVDLSAATGEALLFWEDGAEISVDGSSLLFSEDYGAITLISFLSGHGPSLASQANVEFTYSGFDPLFAPVLTWTETGLELSLNAVPEPTTTAMLLGAGTLGWVVFRRRRQN